MHMKDALKIFNSDFIQLKTLLSSKYKLFICLLYINMFQYKTINMLDFHRYFFRLLCTHWDIILHKSNG